MALAQIENKKAKAHNDEQKKRELKRKQKQTRNLHGTQQEMTYTDENNKIARAKAKTSGATGKQREPE